MDKIIHPDWGINDFRQLAPLIESLKEMMVRIGNDIEQINNIPKPLGEKGNQWIEQFYYTLNELKNFDINESKKSAFRDRDTLVNEVSLKLRDYLTGAGTYDSVNFLTVYTTIISYEEPGELYNINESYNRLAAELTEQKSHYNKSIEDLETAQQKYDDLISLLTNTAKEKTTEDYAKIFQIEAQNNQSSSITWLAVAIISIILFCVFILYEDNILPIPANSNSALITLEYIKRLLIVSFFIYVITFIFKQYSIKKHLETLNTHRENTLNSYNLFIKSMGTAEQDVKNALMVEVARAIYESGQTGYINSKDEGTNSSSIMEVTKFIKPNA